MLTFEAKIRRIHNMEKAGIKVIADYLKDLEEGLDEWDYRGRVSYLRPHSYALSSRTFCRRRCGIANTRLKLGCLCDNV
jgi:hypothetical protein